MKRSRILVALALAWLPLGVRAAEMDRVDPASFVTSLLAAPERVDFGRAKLAIDAVIDPSTDVAKTEAELDAMSAEVRRMLATLPPGEAEKSLDRIRALIAFLYRAGRWNAERPFAYDMADPNGQKIGNQLLSTYLATRRGNCV